MFDIDFGTGENGGTDAAWWVLLVVAVLAVGGFLTHWLAFGWQ